MSQFENLNDIESEVARIQSNEEEILPALTKLLYKMVCQTLDEPTSDNLILARYVMDQIVQQGFAWACEPSVRHLLTTLRSKKVAEDLVLIAETMLRTIVHQKKQPNQTFIDALQRIEHEDISQQTAINSAKPPIFPVGSIPLNADLSSPSFGGQPKNYSDTDVSKTASRLPRFTNPRLQGVGRVKFFNADKGYGFISPEDGGDDVFVHITSVGGAGIENLNQGDRVQFDFELDKNGNQIHAKLSSGD